MADLAGAVREGLLGFCADVGLVVMRQMLDTEMTERVGPKHARLAQRSANWHGTTTGPVVLGGRELSVERPRGRTVDGREIELDSWAVFSSRDLLTQLTVERMLAGVATRRHADIDPSLGPSWKPVGEALAGWLRRGRPRCECTTVFTRVRAPHRKLTSGGVSQIVRAATVRAGLPAVHAHRLRHTAATEMLRAGASLPEVGQVLRHASGSARVTAPSTTTTNAPRS